MLHPVSKQAYKLKLQKKEKIYNIFHVLLLEQDNTRKKQVDENVTELESDAGDNKKYKVEAIWDSTIYVMESESGYLPRLYYLIIWKGYSQEKNT